jgi:exonuclease III
MNLRVTTLNCRGVKTSLPELHALCASSDVIFLQETWLAKSEITILKNLHADFYADGLSSFADDEILVGRPHGGLAVMWRKSIASSVSLIKLHDQQRLMGLTFNCNGDLLLFLNVYMPCDLGSRTDANFDEFSNTLCGALSMIEQHPGQNAFVIGDFNACTQRSSLFAGELRAVCEDNNLVLSDLCMLSSDTFTFLSECHHSTSWLDHCVCTPTAHQLISEMTVDYSFQSSDHYPVIFPVRLPFSLSAPADFCPLTPECTILLLLDPGIFA